jgi:glycosyltransferase involved in cell wall biosynthesis
VGLANEDYLVYECFDEYRLSISEGLPLAHVENWEKKLLGRANLVLTTSRLLFADRSMRHANVYYTPNGVDFDLFAYGASGPAPADISAVPHPIVGYFGNVTTFLDYDLLKRLCEECPDLSLVMIGPIDPIVQKQVRELSLYRGVRFLWAKPHICLPSYLRILDAIILPFKTNAWNQHQNPLVLWESLAAGRPIVITNLPIAAELADIVFVADDPGEFVDKVHLALQDSHVDRLRRGVEAARERSWNRLTASTWQIIKENVKCQD